MSDSVRPHRWQPTRLPHHWDSPGKNTGVGCHALLQGIFPTQGSNRGHLHCRQILYHWSTREALLPPAAAAAKSLQSCLTVCNPIDGSLPGSPIPRIFQAGTLEWVAISFSHAWKWKVKAKFYLYLSKSFFSEPDSAKLAPTKGNGLIYALYQFYSFNTLCCHLLWMKYWSLQLY